LRAGTHAPVRHPATGAAARMVNRHANPPSQGWCVQAGPGVHAPRPAASIVRRTFPPARSLPLLPPAALPPRALALVEEGPHRGEPEAAAGPRLAGARMFGTRDLPVHLGEQLDGESDHDVRTALAHDGLL